MQVLSINSRETYASYHPFLAKDMPQHETYSRYSRASLQLDPPSAIKDEEMSNASPGSATSHSPANSFLQNPSQDQEGADFDNDKEPSSGPQRSRSEKEKRKRSRVTPEQLMHLERYFSVDRSPTAARRREISELLGMQERQTQIWFQNRRAKAKLQDGKHNPRGDSTEAPPDTPPQLSTGFQVDLHNLIHEDEPVTIIPCTDLSVGTWRRIATSMSKHDLVAYVSDVKRCLTWFIHSGGHGFKMEIPFHTIVDTEFKNASPGSGMAAFVLSQPPIFYLENMSSPRGDGSTVRTWKRCSDWTENHQATHVLRHTLIGSAVQLAHVLRNLHASDVSSEIPLRAPPSHRSDPRISSPMELPSPPLAALQASGYNYSGLSMKPSHLDHVDAGPKRSSFGAQEPRYLGEDSVRPPPHSAPTGSFPPHSYGPLSHRSSSTPTNFEPSIFPSYHQNIHQGLTAVDYSAIPPQQGPSHRSYASQPQSYFHNNPRSLHQSSSGANIDQHIVYNTPSPPLLTTPYHPERLAGHPNRHRPSSPRAMSGLGGMSYDVDEDLRHQRGQ